MTRTDFQKVFDMVPRSWILEWLRLIGATENDLELLKNSMKDLRTNLFSEEPALGSFNINRGIFQGDSIFPLVFIIKMIPLTIVLRKKQQSYSFGDDKFRLNHLFFYGWLEAIWERKKRDWHSCEDNKIINKWNWNAFCNSQIQ